jgi:hypothetical protein
MEQLVNLETDEVFNWPWMYAVEPGHWELSDAQAKRFAGLPAARRVSDDGRFPRHHGVGDLHAEHAEGVPRPSLLSTSRTATTSSMSCMT